MRRHSLSVLLSAVLAAVCICGGYAHAADTSDAAPGAATGAAQDARVSVLTGDEVIQILDETVDWYRTLGTQQQ
ncbi:MAG: hypothetical protein QOG17_3285, partial [Gammaproteobacteria bacterium]|nr:hypothetical protein [Gammaproteobacteria bacterium]